MGSRPRLNTGERNDQFLGNLKKVAAKNELKGLKSIATMTDEEKIDYQSKLGKDKQKRESTIAQSDAFKGKHVGRGSTHGAKGRNSFRSAGNEKSSTRNLFHSGTGNLGSGDEDDEEDNSGIEVEARPFQVRARGAFARKLLFSYFFPLGRKLNWPKLMSGRFISSQLC
jgi:hypothetical protein